MRIFMKISALFFLLTGCGFSHHIGNANLKPDLIAKIEKGKTSKEQILLLLGPPQTTRVQTPVIPSTDPAIKLPIALTSPEVWSYWSNNIEGTAVVLPFIAQTTTTHSSYIVTIYFDNSGIVTDIATSQTNN